MMVIKRILYLGLVMLSMVSAARAQNDVDLQSLDWTTWGGPNGDFTVDAKGLLDKWPADGPKQLWKRTLGEGYSSIFAKTAICLPASAPLTKKSSSRLTQHPVELTGNTAMHAKSGTTCALALVWDPTRLHLSSTIESSQLESPASSAASTSRPENFIGSKTCLKSLAAENE